MEIDGVMLDGLVTEYTFDTKGAHTVKYELYDETNLGANAFNGCSNLTSADIPASVTSIGNSAFKECSGLTSIDIPNSITSIGEQSFRSCSSLTSVIIPNSVISIGKTTFSGCSNLTSVTIGSGITSIGSDTFKNCTSLTSVRSLAMTAPTINKSTFQQVKEGGILTVPSDSTGYDVWMGTGNYYLGLYN